MKSIQFLLVTAMVLAAPEFSYSQTLRHIMTIPERTLEGKYEGNSEGDQMLNYYNNDYCDYYLFQVNDRSYNLKPGKNTVLTIRKGSNADYTFKKAKEFYRFRGIFPKNFDIATPYALPVKDGEKTGWETDRRERRKTMHFRMAPGDTVCATRYGVACVTTDPRLLLVYHQDCTFAAYLTMTENFISPGDVVRPGQPVGIAGPSGVAVSFFFLDENKFGDNYLPDGYAYLHFIPTFSTGEGLVQPEEKKFYRAVTDDGLVMKEMTKREQKRYLKEKGAAGKSADGGKGKQDGSIRITWLEDPVSEKDKERISGLIGHELGFYGRLGMDKDLKLTVYTFHDKKDAGEFLDKKFGRSVDVRNTAGIYLTKEQAVVIIGYDEKDSDRNVKVICHEISHHLLRNIAGPGVPVWLNEGLARYFENCTVDRKGNVHHVLSDGEKGRIRSAFMIGEIDLADYLDTWHGDFMLHQRTDDGISYTLAHALTTLLMDKGDTGTIQALMKLGKDGSCTATMSGIYPGGLEGLEKDLESLVAE